MPDAARERAGRPRPRAERVGPSRAHAPSRGELDEIVSQLSGSMVLGLESSAARMNRLARAEIFGIPIEPPLDLIERIRSVTPEQVSGMAGQPLGQPKALSLVGPPTDVAI